MNNKLERLLVEASNLIQRICRGQLKREQRGPGIFILVIRYAANFSREFYCEPERIATGTDIGGLVKS